MKKDKMSVGISFLIFLVVIAFFVYITNNNNNNNSNTNNNNDIMQNIQQIEGVKITILQEGTGEVAKSGDIITVNYTGKLEDGTVFDSNIDPKFNHVEPFTFNLGVGQVIKGWDEGVIGMKVGEKRILEISPESAYGATGAGDVIPPNATITFEVELLQIQIKN